MNELSPSLHTKRYEESDHQTRIESVSREIEDILSNGAWASVPEALTHARELGISNEDLKLQKLFSQAIAVYIGNRWWNFVREALTLAHEYGITDEELSLKDTTETFSHTISEDISRGQWRSVREALTLAHELGLTNEELSLKDNTKAFSQSITENFSSRYFGSVREALTLAHELGFTNEELSFKDTTETFSHTISEDISRGQWGSVREALTLAHELGLTNEELSLKDNTEAFSQAITKHISRYEWVSASIVRTFAHECEITDEELSFKDNTREFNKLLTNYISNNWWDNALEVLAHARAFGITNEELKLAETLSQAISLNISKGELRYVERVLTCAHKSGITNEELKLAETFSQAISVNISKGQWDSVRIGLTLAHKCGITDEGLSLRNNTETFSQGISLFVSKGQWDSARKGLTLAHELGVTNEELSLKDNTEAFSQGISQDISKGWWDSACKGLTLAHELGVTNEELSLKDNMKTLSQAISLNMSFVQWDSARKGLTLAHELGITNEELKMTEALSQAITSDISYRRWDSVRTGQALAHELGITNEELKVTEAFSQEITSHISDGQWDSVHDALTVAHESGINFSELLKTELISSLRTSSLKNAVKIVKSARQFAYHDVIEEYNNVVQEWKNSIIKSEDLTKKKELLTFLVDLVSHGDTELLKDNMVTTAVIESKITGNPEMGWNQPDKEVAQHYQALAGLVGESRLRKALAVNTGFWENLHDSLLFVQSILSRSPDDQKYIRDLVLMPLTFDEVHFSELNNSFGSFDVNVYIEKCNNMMIPFRTWAEFTREVQMQKFNIVIPSVASPAFRDAVAELISAPGVDVPFIRKMIDTYTEALSTESLAKFKTVFPSSSPLDEEIGENDGDIETDEEDDEYDDEDLGNVYNDTDNWAEFSEQLIAIIEYPETIDGAQLLKPFSKEIPFDPLYKVLLSAIGIHGLNQQTTKLYDAVESNPLLQRIILRLRESDKHTTEILTQKRDKLKQEDPNRSGRYDVESRKEIAKSMALKIGDSSILNGIRIENREQYMQNLTLAERAEITSTLEQALADTSLRQSVNRVLSTLAGSDESRQALVESFVDINLPFLRDVLPKLRTISDFSTLSNEEILHCFDSDGLALVELLLFLGFNNRERQRKSKQLLAMIEPILKKPHYKLQSNDPRTAYLSGKLALTPDDETAIRESLHTMFGDEIGGRTLGIEIAKKSDPRGWVCGDYTNCCMPFTSKKNREYLLRPDMAYFLVSQIDQDEAQSIIAQSVMVYCEDEKQITIALDNIEVANRAIQYTPVIAEGYRQLKEDLILTYGSLGKRLKIVIGTSYNDDGGLVTGECELVPVDARPKGGDVHYSDWLYNHSNYLFYDSEVELKHQRYFGLSQDMWERSRVKDFLSAHQSSNHNREVTSIEHHLRSIGRGEDDGDGGLTFPNNYSCAIERGGKNVGYVIGADYISDDTEDDIVHLELLRLDETLPETERDAILNEYLTDRGFEDNEDIDGLHFSKDLLEQSPYVYDVIAQRFGERVERQKDGGALIRFLRVDEDDEQG